MVEDVAVVNYRWSCSRRIDSRRRKCTSSSRRGCSNSCSISSSIWRSNSNGSSFSTCGEERVEAVLVVVVIFVVGTKVAVEMCKGVVEPV